jgi:iron complex outermembrane receptor protein
VLFDHQQHTNMKKILLLSFLGLQLSSAIAQKNTPRISGKVTDEKGSALTSATISLLRLNDSALVKMTLADETGNFHLDGIPFGNYLVRASALEHNPATVRLAVYDQAHPVAEAGSILLQLATKTMNAIVVSGKRSLIEQKADRMVVNVDASVTSLGATALEVLEKTPGVSVDKDGKIALKGKPDVIIMIDGKPSYLSPSEVASLLSSMSASQISQLEIMTNPSAKYDALGNAGIINIKTKKLTAQGFNASLNLSYGQGVYPKTNNSLNLNYRSGKVSTFLNLGYSRNTGFMDFDIDRKFLEANGSIRSELKQLSNRKNLTTSTTWKWGMDYSLTPKTTIGLVAGGFFTPQHQDALTNSQVLDGNGAQLSTEVTTKTVRNEWKNASLGLTARHQLGKAGQELSGGLDYLHYDFTGNQDLTGATYAPSGEQVGTTRLRNELPLSIDIYSGRLDYILPLKGSANLEAGLKSSIVKTGNESVFYTLANPGWTLNQPQSSRFEYQENIQAAYLNVNKKAGAWYGQAGLRVERTKYDGRTASFDGKQDSSFNRSYVDLFPNLLVTYTLDGNNSFVLSAGRRIDRPAYQNLNPFISFIDRYTYSTGNPYLQPQYSNTVEISHTFKKFLTTTINYSVIHDMINEVLTHQDSVIIRSIGNIGTRYNVGISMNASLPVTRFYSATLFVNLYQNRYDGVINGENFKASQLTFSMNMSNQFSWGKGWNAELSGNYTSQSRDEGQAIVLPLGQLSAGVSKTILHTKGTVKLGVRDIFYTQNPREIQNFQDISSTLHISRDTRVITLGFVYRFGTSVKSKPAPARTMEEQERVKING